MQEKLVHLISYASSCCTWKYPVTMPLGSPAQLAAQHYAGNGSCNNLPKHLSAEKLNRGTTTLVFHGLTQTVCKHGWLVWPDVLPWGPHDKSHGLFSCWIIFTRVSHHVRNECAGSDEFGLGTQSSAWLLLFWGVISLKLWVFQCFSRRRDGFFCLSFCLFCKLCVLKKIFFKYYF